jgi:DNA-binding transcriptional MocR family regulator
MKRYEKFADDIAELIRSGVLGPGQRVPSVRYASQTYGVSPSTVFQAYYLLERRGLIRARPRSGYFVNAHAPSPFSEPVVSSTSRIHRSRCQRTGVLGPRLDQGPHTVPFGSAFPSPMLFPLPRLSRSLASASREWTRAWWSPTCRRATRNCAGRSPCATWSAG